MTCLLFTTYVARALIVVMRRSTSNIEEICEHLIHRGFMSGYTCWTEHGEHNEVVHEGHPTDEKDRSNNVTVEGGNDVSADNNVDDLDEILRNVEGDFTSKSQNKKFSQMMKDYETPVFLGCKKEHNKLHVVLTLLQMKASNGWSNKGFNELLQFLRDLLPKANVLQGFNELLQF